MLSQNTCDQIWKFSKVISQSKDISALIDHVDVICDYVDVICDYVDVICDYVDVICDYVDVILINTRQLRVFIASEYSSFRQSTKFFTTEKPYFLIYTDTLGG